MEDNSTEYRKILENVYHCCREHLNDDWILEPYENIEGGFRGILFARSNTPIPGCAFVFSMEIDPERLSEPPQIRFCDSISHPLVYPCDGLFCFSQNGIPNLSCRTPIEDILKTLSETFFLKKSYFPSTKFQESVNLEALQQFKTDPKSFWAQLRKSGNLSATPQSFF